VDRLNLSPELDPSEDNWGKHGGITSFAVPLFRQRLYDHKANVIVRVDRAASNIGIEEFEMWSDLFLGP
jgi:hypothetical protein